MHACNLLKISNLINKTYHFCVNFTNNNKAPPPPSSLSYSRSQINTHIPHFNIFEIFPILNTLRVRYKKCMFRLHLWSNKLEITHTLHTHTHKKKSKISLPPLNHNRPNIKLHTKFISKIKLSVFKKIWCSIQGSWVIGSNTGFVEVITWVILELLVQDFGLVILVQDLGL